MYDDFRPNGNQQGHPNVNRFDDDQSSIPPIVPLHGSKGPTFSVPHSSGQVEDDLIQGLERLDQVLPLVSSAGAVRLKAGTEAEGQTVEATQRMALLARGELPLHVKVGGQEPIADLRGLLAARVDSVVFPMIESAFAVEKAAQALRATYGGVPHEAYLNLESRQAWLLLDEILDAAAAFGFKGVNVGRTDLAASLSTVNEDPRITSMVKVVATKAHDRRMEAGVGGCIVPETIASLLEEAPVDTFETRHIKFHRSRVSDGEAAVGLALAFEQAYAQVEGALLTRAAQAHLRRAFALSERLAGSVRSRRG